MLKKPLTSKKLREDMSLEIERLQRRQATFIEKVQVDWASAMRTSCQGFEDAAELHVYEGVVARIDGDKPLSGIKAYAHR